MKFLFMIVAFAILIDLSISYSTAYYTGGGYSVDAYPASYVEEAPRVNIDLHGLAQQAASLRNTNDDIEEDEDDRFITKRNGLLRPTKQKGNDAWAEETNSAPLSSEGVLIRKKRCGGGDDDDDGDANRARYVKRRVKRKKVKGKRKKKNSKTTTTVKVIQNGQVVSESVQNGPLANSQVISHVQQPTIHLNQPQAAVHVQPNMAVQVQPQQVSHLYQQPAAVHVQHQKPVAQVASTPVQVQNNPAVVQTVQHVQTAQVHSVQPQVAVIPAQVTTIH